MRDLVIRMQGHLPEAEIRGATLAADGALVRAVTGLRAPVLCPWFMTDGWFVGTHLPKRLQTAGLERWRSTAPMGLMPGLDALMAARVASCLATHGWQAADTTVIFAAHGSPSARRPRDVTEAAARALARQMPLKDIRPCFVDEPPAIRDAARVDGPALVLPFFAAQAGHVTDDLPEELSAAGFSGPVLDPVGVWAETATLAAQQIKAALTLSHAARDKS
jgi:sirohydrochlorin ferrochelatase